MPGHGIVGGKSGMMDQAQANPNPNRHKVGNQPLENSGATAMNARIRVAGQTTSSNRWFA